MKCADLSGQIKNLFRELNGAIEKANDELRKDGRHPLPKARIRLLGQISLLVDAEVSSFLSLAQTVDLDALIDMDHAVKLELKELLRQAGYVYDEDSTLIWIPPNSRFVMVEDLAHVVVEAIDPESALVSKGIKAPEKNAHLIREAIASNRFPALVDRILENGGKLEDFV